MFDFHVTSQLAEARRQDLLAEATRDRLAKSVREQRRPRRLGMFRTSRAAAR